jgi:lipopolysaccharide/colanic/teichoic acid biosynthesis glycosyltransferase
LDLIILALLAVPASLIGLACALAIKLSSQGPVFFRQERIGQWGKPFRVVKFRTMVHEAAGNPILPDPRRITPVGRWLRRLSLDELPQLLNVAAGGMSIVGPRPALPYQVERYDERQRRRLVVRPGLTGLAQIRGRNRTSWAERIEYDLEYIDQQSLWLDLRILWSTIPTVVSGTGISGHPSDDPLVSPPQ